MAWGPAYSPTSWLADDGLRPPPPITEAVATRRAVIDQPTPALALAVTVMPSAKRTSWSLDQPRSAMLQAWIWT